MKVDIGLSDKARKQIADGLSHLLADTYALYLKTQNFHWNVTGPHFISLHKMFEEQYDALAGATDTLAERIRALDLFVPASFSQFSKLTCIKEETKPLSWDKMVAQLLTGHEAVVHTARSMFDVVEAAADEVTLNLLAERMDYHEKTAWMLRSTLS